MLSLPKMSLRIISQLKSVKLSSISSFSTITLNLEQTHTYPSVSSVELNADVFFFYYLTIGQSYFVLHSKWILPLPENVMVRCMAVTNKV